MKNLGYYLSTLKKQKLELASALNNKGSVSDVRESLESLIDKTHQLGYGDGKPLSFYSSKNSITIKICGSGSVNVYGNETLLRTITLNDDKEVVEEVINVENGNQCYWFDTLAGVTELNLSNNDITTISIFGDNQLNKLVLYGNNITQLNCSYCKELQFLHIFNNPLCDEEEYEVNLENTIESLPNRADKAIGSIVFYPWYGLEKLICKDSDDNWIKYPNNHVPLEFEDDRLYGVVNDNTIIYYTYKNGGLVNHTSMNRHHTLRKEYESNITLAKNWLFGSAIQYSEDYQYCYYHFRQSGVQDVWETAEKGFGMCIGSIDQHTGTTFGWEDMNVKRYWSNNSSDIYTKNHPNWEWSYTANGVTYPMGVANGKWSHGDFILSQLAGRGERPGYGLCPNAQVFLFDVWYVEGNEAPQYSTSPPNHIIRDYVKSITENCNSFSSSFIRWSVAEDQKQYSDEMRKYLGDFGKDNIITVSAGNLGDGQPWTYYSPENFTWMYGNYGTDDDITSTENHSTTFFVPAIAPNNVMSSYSSCSVCANMSDYGEFIADEDYISGYGDQILGYINYTEDRGIKQGTSIASPNCNGLLALMRVIYSKINSSCQSFGKGSEFMDYVKTHWMDTLDDQMTFAIGMGAPSFLAKPKEKKKLLTQFSGALLSSENYAIGEPINLIDSIPSSCKKGLTCEFNPKYYAQIDSTTLIPIRNPLTGTPSGDDIQDGRKITIYTNSSVEGGAKDANYFKTELPIGEIAEVNYSLIDDTSRITGINTDFVAGGMVYDNYIVPVITDDQAKDSFTVQFVGKFTPEALIPSITETGEYYGNSVFFMVANINSEERLTLRLIGIDITVLPDGTKQIKFVAPYDEKNSESSITKFVLKDQPNTVYCGTYANYFSFKGAENDNFVITLRFNQEAIEVFYNGNCILYANAQTHTYKLSDVGINRISTANDSADDVIFYNRALSHDEIIKNTIALIQREENN